MEKALLPFARLRKGGNYGDGTKLVGVRLKSNFEGVVPRLLGIGTEGFVEDLVEHRDEDVAGVEFCGTTKVFGLYWAGERGIVAVDNRDFIGAGEEGENSFHGDVVAVDFLDVISGGEGEGGCKDEDEERTHFGRASWGIRQECAGRNIGR